MERHDPELVNLQTEYAAWLEALPDNQQETATAEALQAIVDLDLSELSGDRAAERFRP